MGDNSGGVSRRDYLRGIGAAGAATGLAGCGFLNSATGGGGPDVYTMAATVPKSGEYSNLGPQIERGLELGNTFLKSEYFEDAELNLVLRDDESDPDTAASQLESIQSEQDDDLNLVIGSYGNELSQAAASFAEEQEVLCLTPFFPYAQPHRDSGYEYTFSIGAKSQSIALSTADNLDEFGADERPSTVGILERDDGWGTEMADAWETQLGEADGSYDVALRETHEPGATDFGDLVSQASEAGVEVLLSNPGLESGVAIIEAMKSAGFAPTLTHLEWAANRPAWWSELGSDSEYVLSSPGWVPGTTGPGNATLYEEYGNEYDLADDELVPPATGTAYSLTYFLRFAFQGLDPFDQSEVIENIRDTEIDTLWAQYNFDETTDGTVNGIPRARGFAPPIGQWLTSEEFETGQRRVYPRGDSFYGAALQSPMPAWSER
ncbi:MAG: ABC transporter substrate-binding protein [Haloarculaceae archaeon]